MDAKIFSGVLGISLFAIAVGLLIPVDRAQLPSTLPWQIENNKQGHTRVFGLNLNQSTVQDAENQFSSPAEISLFVEPDGTKVLEAYFDKITLNGLRAKMILVIEVSSEQLHGLFQRGARISTLGNARKKVVLNTQDLAQVRKHTIKSITYLPSAKLQDALIRKHFGEPIQQIKESNSDMTHWLYPQLGLDVALNAKGKAVMQYISPQSFSEISKPLLENN